MHEIRIPRLGWSMEQGTFLRWLKSHGDMVKKGDAIFELEGDKNVQEIESVEAGILNIPPGSPFPGSTVDVGTLLGYLVNDDETATFNEIQPGKKTPVEKSQAHAGPAARRMAAELGLSLESITGTGRSGLITKEDVSSAAEMQFTQNSSSKTIKNQINKVATPRARRLALDNNLDWKTLTGTGKGGRIRESDVINLIKNLSDESNSETQTLGKKLSPRRRAIAERLRLSQQRTVPVTLHTRADVTELVALRDRLKSNSPGATPSYNDLICSLLPRVLKLHPQLAQIWDHNHERLIPCVSEAINIGIAVDTSSGLIVPVLRGVAGKTLDQITAESRRLIDMARSGNLPGEAMRGGCITITNLGSFGIDGFTPVINLPEISILGLGAIRREPVFLNDDKVVARQFMTLSLTFDHAAIDGAPAAAFLRDIAAALADPAAFLLNSPA